LTAARRRVETVILNTGGPLYGRETSGDGDAADPGADA
jgi:hypothetical protein